MPLRRREIGAKPAMLRANIGGGTGGCRESSVVATGTKQPTRTAPRVSAAFPRRCRPSWRRLASTISPSVNVCSRCSTSDANTLWSGSPGRPGPGKPCWSRATSTLAGCRASGIRSTRATPIRPRCFTTCGRRSLPLAKRACRCSRRNTCPTSPVSLAAFSANCSPGYRDRPRWCWIISTKHRRQRHFG